MSNLASSNGSENSNGNGTTMVASPRRSTRIFQSVRLNVSGQNASGYALYESTSALAVNCHGCVYASRYEYRSGAWVTLQVTSQGPNGQAHAVRAQVKFVRLPGSPRELYQVGVELERPANIWGIPVPPQDWLRFPRHGISTGANGAEASFETDTTHALDHPADGEKKSLEHISSPLALSNGVAVVRQPSPAPLSGEEKTVQPSPADPLHRALEGILQQAAEKAVNAALASRLAASVNKAAAAIEKFSQASVHRVEERCERIQEKFEESLRQDLAARVQEAAAAERQLREAIEKALHSAEQAAHRLETAATEIPSRLAAAQTDMQSSAQVLQSLFSTRLREISDRASSDFRDEAARVCGEQLSFWNEKVATAMQVTEEQLKERTSEAHARLDAAAAGATTQLHATADNEITRVNGRFRESAKTSFSSFAAETRAEWDARQSAALEEIARLSETELAQCRERLDAILQSAMSSALSTANEHSRVLFESLLRGAAEKIDARAR